MQQVKVNCGVCRVYFSTEVFNLIKIVVLLEIFGFTCRIFVSSNIITFMTMMKRNNLHTFHCTLAEFGTATEIWPSIICQKETISFTLCTSLLVVKSQMFLIKIKIFCYVTNLRLSCLSMTHLVFTKKNQPNFYINEIGK